MYQYYIGIEDEEHMLYSKEIALAYGFVKDGQPQYAKVVSIIKNYIKNNGIRYNKIYFNTRNGLKQVFPKAIYSPAITEYIANEMAKEVSYCE